MELASPLENSHTQGFTRELLLKRHGHETPADYFRI